MQEDNGNKTIERKFVRLINNPTQVGILTGREQPRRNRKMLQVQFSTGTRWVPEQQLKIIENKQLSPLDMLESQKLGRPIDLRRALTHVKLSGRLADVIYSMEATNTDFYAYQFKPVIKVLESPTNGILIADEVGLGKTIEAGLIWTELRSRFDMRRLLVICPAALREKWCRELSTKIGVYAQICDAKETLKILQDEEMNSRGFAIVASMQGLRPLRGWEEDDVRGPTADLARFLRQKENEDRLVDLLVIDEAHHLRNPETQTNELGQLCKNVSDYTILLTATPIHNRNEDLFSLLRLLDPDTFTRSEVFSQILEANAPLIQARDLVLKTNFEKEKLYELLHEARQHSLLRDNRQLSIIEETEIKPEQLHRRDIRSRLAYRLETVNLLAHVVTRTRKRDVKEWRVIREPILELVDLDPVEEKFYNLVSEVVIEYARQRMANERFLLAQPQRQMTSSMAASLRSWQNKLIDLEMTKESDDDLGTDSMQNVLGPVVGEIVKRSKNYVNLDHLIAVDTKYKRLCKILRDYLHDYSGEKVVVFSAFRATLAYLAERLSSDGISCIQLKGGQRETKDEIINLFRKPEGPNVLLSSEVGGEGVDLQFSRVVINYDLPWNPMRLEQRIGRIDRLGQKAKIVVIWNILYADTIDARIYNRLYVKLDLCRKALGDFEAILGNKIRKLEIELLSGQLTAEQQNQLVDQTAQALENLRLEEQKLEQDAASLVAYGDYILNQVQAARELHRWISGGDILRYVSDYLRLYYSGCELHQIEAGSMIVELELSNKAKFDLAEYIKEHRISYHTKLANATRPVRCLFENRVTGPQRRTEEIISQFHPLVRMISFNITNGEEQLTPAVALTLNKDEIEIAIPQGIYILAVSLWSFRGLQDTEKLAYAAALFENPDLVIDPDDAERLAIASIVFGQDWLEARNSIDLEHAYYVANDFLFYMLNRDYENYLRELEARNEDRADIQLQTLNQHLRKQNENLQEILLKHQMAGRETLVKATEGRIRALKNRVEQQRLKIENRRTVQSEDREIALAVIRIK
ncbi:MAG: SNF2-related protein [Bacillota bacterium]|nr:SNF2-related protein [Bacillota bacterium]